METYYKTPKEGITLLEASVAKGFTHRGGVGLEELKKDLKRVMKIDHTETSVYVFGIDEDEETKTFCLFLKSVKI